MVLGAKMGPSWVQMAQKLKLKKEYKKDDLLNAFKIDFGSQNPPKREPGGEGKLSLFGALLVSWCLLGASWGQDGPKTPPETSQD